MHRLALLLAALFFVSLGLLAAETKPADTKPVTGAAEAKVDKASDKTLDKYTGAEHPHGFYIEPGVSALVFSGPERSLPIYEGLPGSIGRSGKLLRPRSEEDVVPEFRLAAGFVFDNTPKCMGENFRVELSTDFWWNDQKETQHLPSVSDAAHAVLYSAESPGQSIDYAGIYFVLGTPPKVVRDTEYRFVDANFALKTDYRASDLISFTPSLGCVYAELDYDARVKCVGNPETYTLKETLDTKFLGAVVGLDLNLQVMKRFRVSVGGTIAPMVTSTECKVYNSWNATGFPNNGSFYGFHDRDDVLTFRTTGTATFSYQALSWFKVSAFGGVEYWDRVARVAYPTYIVGQNPFLAGAGFPKIGYGSMTNFRAGLNLTFIIGK